MYPKPHRNVSPLQKRLSVGRKAVTVCIATIHRETVNNQPLTRILTASDRRISLFAGDFSEPHAIKFTSVHPQWMAMFAGNVEETRLMLKAIAKALENIPDNSFEKVVEYCRPAYIKQRRRLIETEILPDFDLLKYSDFQKPAVPMRLII
jgi:hypothetical protein